MKTQKEKPRKNTNPNKDGRIVQVQTRLTIDEHQQILYIANVIFDGNMSICQHKMISDSIPKFMSIAKQMDSNSDLSPFQI
jgi:hypothetical protein